MQHLPLYISITFVLTTIITIWLFYKAAHESKTVLTVLISWLTVQTIIGLTGFYTVTTSFPPRFIFLVLPPLILIISLFLTKKGKVFVDNLDIKTLTILHIIRIPVEIVLLWLYLHKAVPELMTFEGRNFDILSGLTAPMIYYFGFVKNKLHRKIVILWNFLCLGLLINVVSIAVLSAPLPFQQFAFEQPNIAILNFPFIWLPGCLVPLVLLSHLATLRQLLQSKSLIEN